MRADIFADRLQQAMDRKQETRSGLARAAGVDRSTIGLLLKRDLPRLPNGQLVADIALALGVSADWLLGLTNRPERPGDIMAAALALSAAGRSSADGQIAEWHREAAGTKIRHVPALLPDMLKTDDVLKWEYAHLGEDHANQAIAAMRGQLEWFHGGESDYEIAVPMHEFAALADGAAYYAGLDEYLRRAQLLHIAEQAEALYPRLRIYLFDAHRVFSAPVTVFGARLGIIYVGQYYLAFRETSRVTAMARHFDWLVREAVIEARDSPAHIRSLA